MLIIAYNCTFSVALCADQFDGSARASLPCSGRLVASNSINDFCLLFLLALYSLILPFSALDCTAQLDHSIV